MNILKQTWASLRKQSSYFWLMILFIFLTTLGFTVWPMTLGGLVFNCTMVLVFAIMLLREGLVAIFQVLVEMRDNAKHEEGTN